MNRGDKAALRLAIGLGLAVLVAYGLALPVPFVVCVMSVLVLSRPGPPLPLVKGLVVALLFAVLVATGIVMVPLLEHYAFAAVLLTAVVLYAIFFLGLASGNPLTTILVLSFTLIPVAGVAEQALVGRLSVTLAVGVSVGVLVSAVSHALFPDPPAPAAAAGAAARVSPDEAAWIALRATLIVMPVFVLALTNPSFYLAAVMKTVALAQQAGETDARSAGRELVGSTLMGAADCGGSVDGLSHLAQPLDADAVADGGVPVDRFGDVRCPAHEVAAVVLEQRADHDLPAARPGDRGQRQRQERLRRLRHAHLPLRGRRALRVEHDPAARALPSRPSTRSSRAASATGGNDMTLRNFLVGVPAMLLCLIVQVAVVFWCVRYCARQTAHDPIRLGWLKAIRPLVVSMLAMMVANVVQIALWGGLFVWLGEFEELYRGDLPLGGELHVARLRRRRDEAGVEAARSARSGQRRADDVDDRGGPDGHPAEHHSIPGRRDRRGAKSTSRFRRMNRSLGAPATGRQ